MMPDKIRIIQNTLNDGSKPVSTVEQFLKKIKETC